MLTPPRPARRCNAAGVAIIKQFEELRLEAYQCPAGKWTVGYGHTGRDVYKGLKITPERAEELLRLDLAVAEAAVSRIVRTKITDDQFAALCSWVFNVGEMNASKSTLIRKLNAQDFLSAWAEFPKWVHSGGKILNGLIRRRAAEQDLFKPKRGDPVS
jgi:lysozyme